MNLDLTDAVQLYLFLFRIWEPSQSHLVVRLLEPGRLFIDVGAHVGYYTLLATSHGADAIAIEPDGETFGQLTENIRMNSAEGQVSVMHAAIASDASGRILHRGPKHNRGLTSTNPKWNLSPSEMVPSSRLSDVIPPEDLERVRVIKIDVEGAEPQVLESLVEILELMSDDLVILLELSPLWWRDKVTTAELLAPLLQQGYRLWTIENSYSPLRYMRANHVYKPEPLEEVPQRSRRLDLVIARSDQALI